MFDIVTIGDIKWDVFLVIPHASVQCTLRKDECKLCIEYGKKIPVESSHAQVAGSAPNVAVGLAVLDRSSAVVATMGNDPTHTMAVDFLTTYGVNTSMIRTKAHRNSSFAAVLNFQGESTQLVVHNPVDIVLPKKLATDWLYVSELGEGYDPLYRQIATLPDVRIACNPGQIQVQEKKKSLFDLLARTEVLFMNLREAHELVGKADVKPTLKRLHALGPKCVVVTDGQNGAYALQGTRAVHCPMFPGPRVEATGAGDAFASGFLGALMHGGDSATGLAWGSVNAASVVGSVGPTEGLLTQSTILKRLKTHPDFVATPL